jgi:cytosine/uracil/thiamine/allantoin permease
MIRNGSFRLAIAAAVGLILGAILGHAIGVNMRSDNLPFFGALGAVVGMGLGCTVYWVIERRPK